MSTKFFLITLLFLSTALLSCTQENDEIEDVLLYCLRTSYKSKQVDLQGELSEFEKYLVDKGILKSTSGQSYYDFCKQVAELNDFPGEIDVVRFDNLYKVRPDEYYNPECLKGLIKIDSSGMISSKYFQMTVKMQEVASTGDVSPFGMANTIISVLSPSDFEKPYYRAIALLTILNTSDIETGLLRTLTPVKPVNDSEYPSVLILANKNNEIVFNDSVVNPETLKIDLYRFIKENGANHVIVFSNEKGTTYDCYLTVQDYIAEVYLRLRNEKSKELFNKSYMELDGTEKDKIKSIFPSNINER